MFRQVFLSKNMQSSLRSTATRMTSTRVQVRAFHSPFAVLATASSPLTTPPGQQSTSEEAKSAYEKQIDASSEPHVTPTGTRTYVVSTPDPADTPYEVPSGAYPNSSPYQHPPATGEKQSDISSSTSAAPAHPTTTRRVPRNEDGVGESASVRNRQAPGEMGARGGSEAGLDLMDKSSTKPGPDGELADRNPPPLSKESEEISKMGNKDAWKARK